MTETKALELVHDTRQAAVVVTPMAMLNQAIDKGLNIDILERLMTLNERWEAAQAKKAFYEAKAAFKADVPDIEKDLVNKQYNSQYASIGNVVNIVNKALSKHSLDAQWQIKQADKITVTCILSHSMGHTESAELTAPADVSGQKNPIQQIKSTITYLRLATFEAVTGIATKEGARDDDGNAAATGLITDEQVDELIRLADETGADKAKVSAWLKVESFSEIPASKFLKAKTALEGRRSSK